MPAAVYATDLTDITTSETIAGWSALGGGQSGLNDETDYFIQGTQCVSKNGFTASTRGQIFNAGATTIASGDAVFFWIKQNNRNLMDTVANGGTQALIGSGTGAFDRFYVDGNDSEGSALAGWRTYAVDPTATPSATTGSPSGTTHFGAQWAILGSGSLKGAPNGIDAIRHGRELQCTEGDLANGYANFDGAATFDNATTRALGLLTPIAGGYQFHGLFAFGTTATAVDFRDSNRNIVILDDPFVGADFNTFEVRNTSSNIELTSISIQALGTTSPGRWVTTDNAPVTLDSCTFTDMGAFGFNTNTTATATTWRRCNTITPSGASVTGCTIDRSIATSAMVESDLTLITGNTFNSSGTGHAVDVGAISTDTTISWDNALTGYVAGVTGSPITTGTSGNEAILSNVASGQTLTINVAAGASIPSVRNTGAGSVNVVAGQVTLTITAQDINTGNLIQDARVYVTAAAGGALAQGTVLIDRVLTNASGQASVTQSYSGNQPITGRVRRATTPPLYKEAPIAGTIDSASGLSLTVQMIPDE